MTDIRKDAMSLIRVQRRTYKSRDFIDLRLWALGDNPNEYIPTPKGITIQPDQIDALIQALRDLDKG